MMSMIINLFKRYKIVIFTSSLIIIVGIVALVITSNLINISKAKEYKNNNYQIVYDSTWKIKEKNDMDITLIHDKNSQVKFEIVSLEDEYKYSSSDDLLDELLYNIKQQNNSYKLISKEKDFVTKYKYDGYKLLYENGDNQVLIVMGKKGDQLLLVVYETNNSYFDILLDSVQSIIYDFHILDESFDLTYKLNVDTSNIEWSKNDDVSKNASKTKNYEIANKNYLVNYSIPENFELSEFNSTNSYFNYRGLSEGSITLTANIRNTNIYEYMDKNGSFTTLYYPYKSMREKKDGYSDFKETLQEVKNSKNKNYIYKNSYKSSTNYGDYDYEEVVMIYELDANHILLIELKASKTKIPKELINNIKLNSSTNYSSYIEEKIVDNSLVGELKKFTDYSNSKIRTITLKVPRDFKEIDRGFNIYESRNYVSGYNENLDIYEYKVEYRLNTSIDSKVESINSSYEIYKTRGNYQVLVNSSNIELNGKNFKMYNGGYTDVGGAMFSNNERNHYYVNSKVLFYEFDDRCCLSIEIKGNGVEISQELLNRLTNFDINIKEK